MNCDMFNQLNIYETKKDPLISIIIPVYNVAPYIREALDSAVNQSYKNLEIISIDDGATDESGQICDEYKTDPRVTVIHQKHQGPGKARNTGLDIATGEYIAFLDPDDAYHPDFIQLILGAIEDADIIECQHEVHQLTLKSKGEPGLSKKAGCYERKKALQCLIEEPSGFGVCNKLFRIELWKDVRFPEGHLYEDYEPICRVFELCKKYIFLDQPLYLYRMRPESTTHTVSRENSQDYKWSHEWLIVFIEERIPEIFTEEHLRMVRQGLAKRMLRDYLKGIIEIEEVKTAWKWVDTKDMSLKHRMGYKMIHHCPWLLKAVYPIYRPLGKLLYNFFGR